jgi:hypothetical protein
LNKKVELFMDTENGNRIVEKLAIALVTHIRTQPIPHHTALNMTASFSSEMPIPT